MDSIRRMHDTARFRKHVLSNGIILWVQESPILVDNEGIVIAFFQNIGSWLDPHGFYGLGHFFEHMPFRGSHRKPSRESLLGPILSLGGNVTGSTARRCTRFVVDGLAPENIDLAIETLYELALHPMIRDEDVAKERGPIEQEFFMVRDDLDSARALILYRFLFGGHPFSHEPVGDISCIRSMKGDVLRAFHENHFHAGTIELVCGGSFAHVPDIVERFDVMFGHDAMPRNRKEPVKHSFKSFLCDAPKEESIEDARFHRDSMHIYYPLNPLSLLEYCAFSFFAGAISRRQDSPLFIKLREQEGLVYEDGLCSVTSWPEWSMFEMNVPAQLERSKIVLDAFRASLEGLTGEFFAKRLMRMQYKRQMDFEHPIGAAKSLVRDVMSFGVPISWREYENVQDALTPDLLLGIRDKILHMNPWICKIKGLAAT